MAKNPANRKEFITSLKEFMLNHGFTGVDLDWEYPVAPDRGGDKDDTKNFVDLVHEMHDAFKNDSATTDFGISVALAPDYWYLQYYDAAAMEQWVDWFGFMAYDLHGVWDSDGKLGHRVRGQTDLTEIAKDIIPLAFDGLPFHKVYMFYSIFFFLVLGRLTNRESQINFGMAYYGRGYKLEGELYIWTATLQGVASANHIVCSRCQLRHDGRFL